MRDTRTMLSRYLRMAAYVVLFGPLLLSGVQSAEGTHSVRIGLRTKQQDVRLQGTGPLSIEAAGEQVLAIDPEQVLVLRPAASGLSVEDSDGQPLATANGKVQVKPVGDAFIRLLGPTRHYDGKPDRPYRGSMEVIPTPDGLTVVNIVDVEPYLWGVVSSEMSPRYPLEALKAQAIAARTYALKNIGRFAQLGYDLDDTPGSQVYGGVFSEDPRTTQAVNETAGMVMTYRGKLVDAVYSSTCGGYTESAENAWGRAVPYLVSVPDFIAPEEPIFPHPRTDDDWTAYLKTARGLNCLQPQYAKPEAFRWVRLVTRKELEAGLPSEYRVGTISAITPLRRGASGRIYALQLKGSEGTVTLQGELPIRKALGGLRSSAFAMETYRDDNGTPVVFAFWGAGWGHGLGMCQVGAVGLADRGWTYDAILTHYYTGITIERR